MPKLLVVFYTRGGNTEAMARAIAEGAEEVEGVDVEVKRADYATVYDFATSDAFAFGSPNYFSYMAGILKDFFDRALSVRDKVAGKPAVAFTSGGGASNAALLSIERMIESLKLRKATNGFACKGAPGDEEKEACRRLGTALAKAIRK